MADDDSFNRFLDDQEEDENKDLAPKQGDFRDPVKEFRDFLVAEYLKVGTFCHMTPDQYLDSPPWMIDGIAKEIDRRLAAYIEKFGKKEGDDSPGLTPLSYHHLELLLFGSSLFGGPEDEDEDQL